MLREILEKKFLYSFSGKLILSIGSIIIVGNAAFWFLLMNDQRDNLVQKTIESSLKLNDVTYRVLKEQMLKGDPAPIQDTLENIGAAWAYRKLRIINCRGKIGFSSDPAEVGTLLPETSFSCKACHGEEIVPGENIPIEQRWTIEERSGGEKVLKALTPIYNERACNQASCHAHGSERGMLGILEADASLGGLDFGLKRHAVATVFYLFVFMGVLSLFLCIALWKLIIKPLEEVLKGIGKVGEGDLSYEIPVQSKDEIGRLASAFNAMTQDLYSAKVELVNWADTLEKKVEEKTEAISRAQDQLVQSEKLASLGRMAAGVAHEINSPLTGVVTFGHLLAKRLPEGSQDREDADVIIEQANRCSSIIQGLLGFARASSQEKVRVNLNDVIHSSLRIVRNKADFFNIRIDLRLDEALPPIRANGPQIQQVFLNMIVNAADAMEGKGTLTIESTIGEWDGKPGIAAIFEDTGGGIAPDDMEKLFEPFFTTKPVGKGTGLGLAVSHGIIQDHGGGIAVSSRPGEGSRFTVWFPHEEVE